MGMWRTRASVRVPAFFGPFAVSASLLIVSCFSSPIWNNFYVVEGVSLNYSMKAGAWGVCTRILNTTGVVGPTMWCTSKISSYNFNFVTNSTGPNIWPSVADDNLLLGLGDTTGAGVVQILTSGQTSLLWIHVIAAIIAALTCLSLVVSPSKLGDGRLAAFQKSGILTFFLAVISFIVTIVAFGIDFTVALSAKNRLNTISGIEAKWGNMQWFALPAFILMLPAFASILMKAD